MNKIKNFKSLFSLIIFASLAGFVGLHLQSKDLILPSTKLTGYQVLVLQLQSLKNNTKLGNDRGIEQVFIFAHPENKKITGPIKNFKKMIKSDPYSIFLDHNENKIETVHKDEFHEVYLVKVTKNNISKTFLWTLITYIDNNKNSFWFTVNVISYQYKREV
tara:strand:- start:1671 stop:2153 length:483 start_codon:yes stop_codon:yes gene_type:complete